MRPIVCAALLAAALPLAARGDDFYRSNQLGMAIGPAAGLSAPKGEWILRVRHEGTSEVRTLFDNGTESERWEESYEGGRLARELFYEGGTLTSDTHFRGALPAEIQDYDGGKPTERTVYHYDGGNLAEVEVFGADEKPSYTVRYLRDVEGRLRGAVRTYPDGRVAESEYSYVQGRLSDEWEGAGKDGELYRYDGGKVAAEETWEGSKLESELSNNNGSGTDVSVQRDLARGRVTTRTYAPDGSLAQEQVAEAGRVVRTTYFSYSGGHLADKVNLEAGSRDESVYSYGDSGDLSKVVLTRNRQLVKETDYTTTRDFVDVLYEDGKPVLRVFFKNGTKDHEEEVTGGEGR